ncbi:MAG: outer membrane protein assembly factor BamD [Catalinimonas sp.]
MPKFFLRWPFLCVLILTAGCSEFTRLQKSSDIDLKYAKSLEYYDEKDYYRAGLLLEELMPLLRGRKEAEKAQFYYAYSQYHQRQLVMSAFYFKNFYETYPRGDYSEEARFMHAVSLFEDSPKPNLDQTNTYESISALETFLNVYPNSSYRERSLGMLETLRDKLELKAFENAKLYYKLVSYNLSFFKSAAIAFENFSQKFPDSAMNEEALYLRLDALYNMARLSTTAKQRERYMDVVDLYYEFVDRYPSSRFMRTAENLYERAADAAGDMAEEEAPTEAAAN